MQNRVISKQAENPISLADKSAYFHFLKPFININFVSSFAAGTIVAVTANPIDKALFVSTKHDSPLLRFENFKHPYQGFFQVFGFRIISAGAYPYFQSVSQKHLEPILRNDLNFQPFPARLVIGLAAGSAYGLVGTFMSTIKCHTWGTTQDTFSSSLSTMYQHGGLRPFFKGLSHTVNRDAIYGVTYEGFYALMLKYMIGNTNVKINPGKSDLTDFTCKATAAGLAAICSSPFNYIKNKQQASHPSAKAPTSQEVLKHLFWHKSTNQLRSMTEIMKSLMIGAGTLRVAFGMAATFTLCEWIKDSLKNLDQEQSKISNKTMKPA